MSFEDTELLVTLTVGEIGYILCNLEDKYGQLLDGEIPEPVSYTHLTLPTRIFV